MHVIIERYNQFPGHGRFEACIQGRASADGVQLGFSIEQPYNGNRRFVSCVPDGDYRLIPFDSPKYGPVFCMVNPDLNVYQFEDDCPDDSGRYLCLFAHVGNWAHDVQGCVALGVSVGFSDDGHMVINSANAIENLRESLPMDTEHKLTIFTKEPATWSF